MSEMIQAIRGMNDVLPDQSYAWRMLEQHFIDCVTQHGYHEIRFPVVESTQLFSRTIGEVTDIVEKEMYTFSDLNGDLLTLRPEGTAGCVRACIEHGLLHRQVQKLWYRGAMFRHERPQRGRYRQFHQCGIEIFGVPGPHVECELLLLSAQLWKRLGLSEVLSLRINTLGQLDERAVYREALVRYFKAHQQELDEDSLRRLERSPLRILDSKNPAMHDLIKNAPPLRDFLGEASLSAFSTLCAGLDALDIAYTIDPCLVRGLDYYGHTVFEWVTTKLGSQATVCAGGRYDTLVEQLGGPPTPGVGLALGVERLLLLLEEIQLTPAVPAPDLFMITFGEAAYFQALRLADQIRQHSALVVQVNDVGGSFKSQFKKADKSGASIALIIGEEEMLQQTVGIKHLRERCEQQTVAQQALVAHILRTI